MSKDTMEKLINYLVEKKKTVLFMLGTLAFWLIMTGAALAVLEGTADGMIAVWIIIITSTYLPAAAFLASGMIIRFMGNKKLLPVALCFILELAESVLPLIFVTLDIRMFWDYPSGNWFLQAAISVGTFVIGFLIATALMKKKEKQHKGE